MNGEDRNDLAVLRAEVNGKLDLLLERTGGLRADVEDHEDRLRDVEVNGSATAREAVEEARKNGTRLAYFSGGLAVLVIVVNLFGQHAIRAIWGS